MSVDVAVIGGGVSGLTTAFALARRGHRVVVLERQVRTGGNALSERCEGFLIEHGPSSLNAASAEVAAYARDLGLDHGRCELGDGVRRRYLEREGRLHGIPVHAMGFMISDYLSLGARLRLLGEPLVARRSDAGTESVEDFFRRRFGAEFAARVVDPLVGGLLAGLPGEISMAAAFPRLVAMERDHGSVVRALIRQHRSGRAMPGRRLFSWRDGVGALPSALAAKLGPAVRTGVAVRRIRGAPGGFRIDGGAAGTLTANAVVLATQPHVAASLIESLDAGAAAALAAIDAPPLAVVFLGYRRDQIAHPLDGLGYLTASSARRAVTGALFCSTMFAGRAPPGHVGIAAYIGGRRAPELACLPAADLVSLAGADLSDLLGAEGAPVFSRVRQWPRGLPQMGLAHASIVARIAQACEAHRGLFITGNYLSGVSVAACLMQADHTAREVHRFLADHHHRKPAIAAATPPECELVPKNQIVG